MSEERIDAFRIGKLLHSRHVPHEWAYFKELRSGTGNSSTRSIDGVAINLWPSKKFRTVAYEIKVSRQDFLREINNPDKRAFAESISHECYFAVPHGLVDPAEVPDTWGLIVANAGGLRVKKIATQRAEVTWPQSFVASIARRCSDEKPETPAILWRVLGREIGEEELLKIAESVRGRTVEQAVETMRYKLRSEVEESPKFKRLNDIDAVLRSHLGNYYTLDDLRECLTGMSMSPEMRRKLKAAHEYLGEIISGDDAKATRPGD